MLKEELHEAMQNLRTMSVQYNNLETKAQIQLETQKETRKKLEQCNSYIQKLQKELQVLRLAEKAATQNARKVEEHKEHVQDLLEENSRLEENLSKLCELPFVQDESTASVDPLLEEQITELECSNARYREQIQELIEGKLDYEEQFVSVRDENKRWREQCEELQSEAEVYRSRRKTNMEDAFTQTIELPEINHENNTPIMKDEITQTKELLNFDYTQTSEQDMHEKSTQTQESSASNQREHQIIQLINLDDGANPDDDEGEKDLMSQEMVALEGNRRHDIPIKKEPPLLSRSVSTIENELEISIEGAELNENLIPIHDRTMIVVDFLNFDTETSRICTGRQPQYNLFVKYNLNIDQYHIEELRTQHISFELYHTKTPQNFEPIAFSTLNMNEIYEQREDKPIHRCLEFISNVSNFVVGHLNVFINFQQPLLERSEIDIYDENDESKCDNSISYIESVKGESSLMQNDERSRHTISNALRYFEINDDVNYIDFLRFVDPPYPILKQIEVLQVISDQLKRYFQSDRFASNDKECLSEEEFVQAVVMLKTDELQLYDIHDLYRHIDTNSDKKVTIQRVLCFLYSPEIKYMRNLFFSFRKSSVNPWGPFRVADINRTGFVSKATFNECIRSIGLQGLAII
jgi:hypothetical protein